MDDETILVNRAPVLTLWAAVVAERAGYGEDEALSLGKAVAGLNAQAKGRTLGIYGPPKGGKGSTPKKVGLGEDYWVQVCGRPVPVKDTEAGVRAVVLDEPIDPGPVRKYLASKFGEALDRVRATMAELAAAFEPEELEEVSYGLYERFRPQIARGEAGWGQKGELKLELLRSLAKRGG